jgi:hypothetical protein
MRFERPATAASRRPAIHGSSRRLAASGIEAAAESAIQETAHSRRRVAMPAPREPCACRDLRPIRAAAFSQRASCKALIAAASPIADRPRRGVELIRHVKIPQRGYGASWSCCKHWRSRQHPGVSTRCNGRRKIVVQTRRKARPGASSFNLPYRVRPPHPCSRLHRFALLCRYARARMKSREAAPLTPRMSASRTGPK